MLSLQELVWRLEAAPGRAALDALAPACLLDPASLRPHLHFRPGCYTRNLVRRTPGWELILNCWSPGAVSPVHDHAGQECWLAVQSGLFQFEDFPLLSGGCGPGPAVLGPARVRGPLGAGHVDVQRGAHAIHRVRALGGGPAVSLHLYAAPLERCLVFDLRRHRCMERVLRYDSVPAAVARPSPAPLPAP